MSSNYGTIKYKLSQKRAPYMSTFKDGKAIRLIDLLELYDKEFRLIRASELIIMQLVDLLNNDKFKGQIYYSTKSICNMLNKHIKNEKNHITVDNCRKILAEEDADNLIFNDYTRYIDINGVQAFTGLISGPYPAIENIYFKNMLFEACEASSFDAFIKSGFTTFVVDSIKDINKLKKAYDYLKDNNIKNIDLGSLKFEKNGFERFNFDIINIIKRFYNCLPYAHKNKWEASNILKESKEYNRNDNYINRHIYINIDMLKNISGTYKKNNNIYKSMKENKKRRNLYLCRNLKFTLYEFIDEFCSNKSEYNTYINNKLKFMNDCKNQFNDSVLACILNENIEERKGTCIYLKNIDEAKKIINRFIRYISKVKQKIDEDDIQRSIDILEKLSINNNIDIVSVEKDLLNQFKLKYLTSTK